MSENLPSRLREMADNLTMRLQRCASFCDMQSHGAKDEIVRQEWLHHGQACRDAASALEAHDEDIEDLKAALDLVQGERKRLEAQLAARTEPPILSKYHGQRGFELERFIKDYEAWTASIRR